MAVKNGSLFLTTTMVFCILQGSTTWRSQIFSDRGALWKLFLQDLAPTLQNQLGFVYIIL